MFKRRSMLSAILVLFVATAGPAFADPAVVSITGPTHIFVEYGGCETRTWTANTNFTPIGYMWKRDGTVVGTGRSYTKRFCSPELDYITVDAHDLGVWAAITHEVDAAKTIFVQVLFDGGCFPQIFCL